MNSRKRVVVSFKFVLKTAFVHRTPSSFRSSHRSSEHRFFDVASTTTSEADFTSANVTTAPILRFGRGNVRTVSSVITPRVPSAPMYSAFSSYPVAFFRVFRRVRNTRPSQVTTRMLTIFSLEVPYRSVLMPLPPVDAMPPIDGLLDGSGPNKTPNGVRNLSSWFFSTPAPTVAVFSPELYVICVRFFVSHTTPPEYATAPPSKPVPAPRVVIGILCLKHNLTTDATCAVESGSTTKSGTRGGWCPASAAYGSLAKRDVSTRSVSPNVCVVVCVVVSEPLSEPLPKAARTASMKFWSTVPYTESAASGG
mmetsp:Transcript_13568/g.44872  ORF Transcript_13568/g.44872 Transcript_13568/m.44872 type:complete len:309 (-) Transcript_13568:1930-2856(-)